MVQESINTGERFIPTQADPAEVLVTLDRYRYAMTYCIDKNVLELGCGTGLGTHLLSLISKKLTAVDYSKQAIDYGCDHYGLELGVNLVNLDLEKQTPEGKFDVVVAIEILEHLENPEKVLAELDTKQLVFSLPLYSLEISTWHKFPIRGGKEGIEDIKKLIEKNFVIEDMAIQEGRWIEGIARRRKSWL